VENFSKEEALWWLLREPRLKCKFTAENTVEIWCLNWSYDVSLYIEHIAILILVEDDPTGRLGNQFVLLLGQLVANTWVDCDVVVGCTSH
jgi:hypothetical protein